MVDKKKTTTKKTTSSKAKPSDLGKGMARKAADAIVSRKKELEKASKY